MNGNLLPFTRHGDGSITFDVPPPDHLVIAPEVLGSFDGQHAICTLLLNARNGSALYVVDGWDPERRCLLATCQSQLGPAARAIMDHANQAAREGKQP